MTHPGYLLIALLGGAILPLQALINARLSFALGNATWATTVSFVIGTIGLLAWLAVTRNALPSLGAALAHPWWIWVGGLMGAVYVLTTIVAVPVLGATALVVTIIAGQMLAGAALDHFGVLTQQQPINLARVLGLALVLGGTILVLRN